MIENNVAAQAGDEPMPCPFCGADAVLSDDKRHTTCLACSAMTWIFVDNWNRRAPDKTASVARGIALEEAAVICSEHAQDQLHMGQHAESLVAEFLAEKIRKYLATTKPGA